MELSKQEQEAIEFMQIRQDLMKGEPECATILEKNIDIILNLIKKQSKVIDKMAKKLEEITINDDDANLLPFRDYNVNIEEIKQYFYRKASI